MADMLINLAALLDLAPIIADQKAKGVEIRRGQPNEEHKIAEWVRDNMNPNWATGCEIALEQTPVTCFIAVEKMHVPTDKSNDATEVIRGFACYDVVTKGVFGPTGVIEEYENSGIDTALLLTCMHEMAALGYKTATIGWTAFIDGNTRTAWSDNYEDTDS